MKINILLLIISLSLFSEAKAQTEEIDMPQFTKILDSLNVKGSILIVDSKNKIAYSNDFAWTKEKRIPASTFKIPNSIIALELKIVDNEESILKWNGLKRNSPAWEQDLTLKAAFQSSCVPCYQEIAEKIGLKRMQKYLKKLNYPGMVFDQSTLTQFWLEGPSKISQTEQIEFLDRLYFSKLPISKHTEQVLKSIMEIEHNKNYTFSGKTGWAIRENKNIGWFVGFLEEDNNVYLFATNIIPKDSMNIEKFPSARIEATKEAFKLLNMLKTTKDE